jgi:glycolate oxidase
MTAEPKAPDAAFLRELEGIVGRRGLVSSPEGRMTYECDMHTFYKGAPDVVVLPESAAQVAAIVRLCRAHSVPVVRGDRGPGSSGAPWPRRAGSWCP